MTGSEWTLTIAVVVLFAVSAVLALAETAFTRMSRIRALALAEDGRRRAVRLSEMLEQPERTLNALLLVILVCQLTTATLVGVLFERQLGAWGVAVGTAVEVAVFFVFAEVAPKTFAIQHTDRAVLAVTPMLSFLTNFVPLRGVSRFLIGVANVVLPGRGLKQGPYVTEEEIRTMADVAADEEAIEGEERRLIHSIFEFGDTVVREVMSPRPDMIVVDADATIEDVITRAIETGRTRLPVREGSTDEIVGVVLLKDLVRRARAGTGQGAARDAALPAPFVPEQKRVAELLREMQTQHFHLAVVVDEHGATAGLVTLEDLLEEIVGEIVDESDVEEPGPERLPDGSLRVPGRMNIDELNEQLGTEFPATEWDTVGGLVLNLLGKVPEDGDVVSFQGHELRTERVQGHRVVSVLVRPPRPAPSAEPGGAPTPGGQGAADAPPVAHRAGSRPAAG